MINDRLMEPVIANVSVVIATLGGDTLAKTIDTLNKGIYMPSEILICIPEGSANRVENISSANVRVVKTPMRGQVAQRAFGFQNVNQPLVLQLDDDVELDTFCLKTLVDFMSDKEKISVSPSLLDNITKKPSSHMAKPDPSSGKLYKLLFLVVNGRKGYEAGKISKAGVNMAYSENATDPYEVEWLPGGCVLHFEKNLVKYNYYPFSGKAYCEDLFHSTILRNNGIKLYHHPAAVCDLDNTSSKGNGVLSLIKIFSTSFKVMYHFATITKKNRLRLAGFFVLNYMILIMKKIKQK